MYIDSCATFLEWNLMSLSPIYKKQDNLVTVVSLRRSGSIVAGVSKSVGALCYI